MKKGFCILVAVLFLLIGVASAWAVPVDKEILYKKVTTLTYPKTYTLRFSLWDAETLGNEVWFEEKSINLTSNTIKTYLGRTNPLDPADFAQQLWVKVEKLKADGITYVPVGARDKLVAGPYALGYDVGTDFTESGTFSSLSAADTTVISTTVSAPTSGFVIVNASGYCLYDGATQDGAACSITTGTALEGDRTACYDQGGSTLGIAPLSMTRGYAVSAGVTTFRLVCQEELGEVRFARPHITAIFVPNRY